MHQTFEKFNEFRRNTLSFIIISPPGNALIFPGERGGRILKFPGDPRTGDPRGQALIAISWNFLTKFTDFSREMKRPKLKHLDFSDCLFCDLDGRKCCCSTTLISYKRGVSHARITSLE